MKFVLFNSGSATLAALFVIALLSAPNTVASFAPSLSRRPFTAAVRSTQTDAEPTKTETDTDDENFSAFAESLDEDSLFEDEGLEDEGDGTWQESLESLLDPSTPLAKRQILLSDLLSANDEIRESVQEALRERKIDSLLTPTGKKLQDGTRAVARQITSDILPSLAATAGKTTIPPAFVEELPTVVPKLGSRIIEAMSSQAKKNLELLQGDLADPSRIPKRISKQTADFAAEAKNVFLETPEGLVGPEYTVVERRKGYEIRDYEAYTVASTSMAKVGEPYSMDDVAAGGTAFNALAAYLFGSNDENRPMEMTTPVTTTSLGEMRFFLKKDGTATDSFPNPLTEEDDGFNERTRVTVTEVPPARLAVRRFTGFVTEGEVARQKDALLSALAVDGVEIDVPHGAVVQHLVFQYNPPYTIPIVRRNEIAVPVRAVKGSDSAALDLESEWGGEEEEAQASEKE